MKRKGSILIEPLIYMFIASLVIILCFNMLSIFMKEFKSVYDKNKMKSKISLETANIKLKSKINMPFITNISVVDNKLLIEHESSKKDIKYKYEVFLDNTDRLKMNYYEFDIKKPISTIEDKKSTNTLLENVEKITFKEKDQLIYLKIKIKQGGEKILVYEKG